MKYGNIFDLSSKTAVVTGGGGLIGFEIAECLNDFGAQVYIADIGEKIGGRVLPECVKFVKMNIISEESVDAALSEVYSGSGKLDVLVNCAYPRTDDWGAVLENVPFASWNKNVNDHLGGYFLTSRRAGELMKKQKRGSIINLASIYGIKSPDFEMYKNTRMTVPAAYSAIKGGIISFSRYLASYYAEFNIRVNVISPGGVFDNQDGVFVKKYIRRTPLNRMANPGDIVGAAAFLASDASEYITGQNIVVDGGWSL